MKEKSFFQCQVCQHHEPKWLGRCPECGSWNSFREAAAVSPPHRGKAAAASPDGSGPVPLASIASREGLRFDAGIDEVNRVLGGGVMKGSAILVGGEPGIGKSTLMLQISALTDTKGRVLYISGEESPGQIRLRADRLRLSCERIEVFCGTELAAILKVLEQVRPVLIVVDSIQTVYSADIGSVPGTVNQIKLCTQELIGWAKGHDAALFLIGHVTKEGVIAGPKVVEHLVDTVLYFDSGTLEVRLLRAEKNRFGSVEEIGIFEMTERGLATVQDPSLIFLTHRQGELPPGVAVVPIYEGSRVLLVEIQSLVVPAKGGISRVYADKIENGRVSRIAAVLEKHLRLRFSDRDVYVNVGGGMRLAEVGIELPLAMALYSARMNQPLPPLTAMVGEVSLAGEVRPVRYLDRRMKTVFEMGYRRFIHPAPAESLSGGGPAAPVNGAGRDRSFPAVTLSEAVRLAFGVPLAKDRPEQPAGPAA
jgi:DNA repair protein RadA/Sms